MVDEYRIGYGRKEMRRGIVAIVRDAAVRKGWDIRLKEGVGVFLQEGARQSQAAPLGSLN